MRNNSISSEAQPGVASTKELGFNMNGCIHYFICFSVLVPMDGVLSLCLSYDFVIAATDGIVEKRSRQSYKVLPCFRARLDGN